MNGLPLAYCPACEETPCQRTDLHAAPGQKLAKPAIRDNWMHRAANMTCVTCMFYVPKVADGGTSHLGRCRRRAPTMAGWPAVFEADWCGDHKIDETKVKET
jgi:hypothetical protein